MSPRARIILVALAVGGVAAAAVFLGRSSPSGGPAPFVRRSAPGTPLPAQCLQAPERAEEPRWYPDDLPLPPDSYAAEDLDTPAPVRSGVFVVPTSLQGFVRHALAVWPEQGWKLGVGESEPGEAEDTFIHSDGKRYGKFTARSVYCDPNLTFVLVQVVLDAPKPSPAGS